MEKFLKFLSQIWKLIQVPLILFVVWILNIRPFTWFSEQKFQEDILGIQGKIASNQLSVNTLGALDVAVLTLIINVILMIIKFFISKIWRYFFKFMAEFTASLLDSQSKKEMLCLKYDPETKTNASILIKGEFNPLVTKEKNPIYFTIFNKLHKSTHLIVDWPSEDLSLEYDSFDPNSKVKTNIGNIQLPLEILCSPNHKKIFKSKLKCTLNQSTMESTEVKIYIQTVAKNKVFSWIFTKIFLCFNTVSLNKIEVVKVEN